MVPLSFQDELVQLLEGYSISTIEDLKSMNPSEKHYLISRLYGCFKSGVQALGNDMRKYRGLKLHYSRDTKKPGVVSAEYEPTFYKKLILYSARCVVSCPVREASTMVGIAKKKRRQGQVRFDSEALRQLRKEGNYIFGPVSYTHLTLPTN